MCVVSGDKNKMFIYFLCAYPENTHCVCQAHVGYFSIANAIVLLQALKSCLKATNKIILVQLYQAFSSVIENFYFPPAVYMLIYYIVPVLCITLTTYPLDYDTFLLQ